jgi:hypothetical protein
MHIQFHQIGFIRRVAAAMTGSLVAVMLYSAAHDLHGVLRAMTPDADTTQVADAYQQKVARVKAFAETLKMVE